MLKTPQKLKETELLWVIEATRNSAPKMTNIRFPEVAYSMQTSILFGTNISDIYKT